MNNIQFIKIDRLFHHPDNPRKDLGDVSELAESIKAKGILQNLTVVPWQQAFQDNGCPEALSHENGYAVVIGNRRLEASTLTDVKELPCIVSDMSYQDQISTMMVENVQRADLTVYEQAQGFQMMLDLGDSVNSIAEKTGFSKKTVKGRLEIAKLDQELLKGLSEERQLSLSDFEKLTQLESIEARNTVLSDIGTANFNSSLAFQIKAQNRKKYLPKAEEWLKSVEAKEIPLKDTWGSKYKSLGPYISIGHWPEEKTKLPKDEKRKLFYHLDDYGTLRLFVKNESAKPIKKSKAELEEERRLAAAHEKAEQLTALAYELRSDFIKELTVTPNNIDEMLNAAVIAGVISNMSYLHINTETVLNAVGVTENAYIIPKNVKNFVDAFRDNGKAAIPSIIQMLLGDRPSKGYASGYKGIFPHYESDASLDFLYAWLTSLGYQMSDDEKAMQDGTHEVLHYGDEKETKGA